MKFIPWGWSDAVCQVAQTRGFQSETPNLSAVQAVNARTFSFQCEQEWGLILAGSRQVESLTELESAVSELHAQQSEQDNAWVVKANFSMSARERMRGLGAQLTEQVRGWAAKRLSNGQPLFLEPWVNRRPKQVVSLKFPDR